MATILPSTLSFLENLAENNDRTWFNEHRASYQKAKENIEQFAQDLTERIATDTSLQAFTPIYKLFRIFRDVRFSKDKSPFKTHFGIIFGANSGTDVASFYVHISPKEAFIGGGIYHPCTATLQRIRQKVAKDYLTLDVILNDTTFKKSFHLIGEQVKSNPKGYAPNHPAIHLLKYKDFVCTQDLSKQDLLSPKFNAICQKQFRIIAPFLQFLAV